MPNLFSDDSGSLELCRKLVRAKITLLTTSVFASVGQKLDLKKCTSESFQGVVDVADLRAKL